MVLKRRDRQMCGSARACTSTARSKLFGTPRAARGAAAARGPSQPVLHLPLALGVVDEPVPSEFE